VEGVPDINSVANLDKKKFVATSLKTKNSGRNLSIHNILVENSNQLYEKRT